MPSGLKANVCSAEGFIQLLTMQDTQVAQLDGSIFVGPDLSMAKVLY